MPRWTAPCPAAPGRRDPPRSCTWRRRPASRSTEDDVESLTSGGGQARSLGLVSVTGPRRVSVALVVTPSAGRHARRSGTSGWTRRAEPARDVRQPGGAGHRTEPAPRAGAAHPRCSRRSTAGGARSWARSRTTCVRRSPRSRRRCRPCARSAPTWAPKTGAELLELIELQSDRLARLVDQPARHDPDRGRAPSSSGRLRSARARRRGAGLAGRHPDARPRPVDAPVDLPLLDARPRAHRPGPRQPARERRGCPAAGSGHLVAAAARRGSTGRVSR